MNETRVWESYKEQQVAESVTNRSINAATIFPPGVLSIRDDKHPRNISVSSISRSPRPPSLSKNSRCSRSLRVAKRQENEEMSPALTYRSLEPQKHPSILENQIEIGKEIIYSENKHSFNRNQALTDSCLDNRPNSVITWMRDDKEVRCQIIWLFVELFF